MDLTHDMIGVEDYELRAARMAALRPDKCPVTDRFRTEVKAVLTGMSLKTITATSTGNTLVVRVWLPALGKGRVMEGSAPAWRSRNEYRFQNALELVFRSFMQTAFKRGLEKGQASSVDAWLQSEWTVKSWGRHWKSSVMKLVMQETGGQCSYIGINVKEDVDVEGDHHLRDRGLKAAFAAALHDLNLTSTVGLIADAMSHNTVASDKKKARAIRSDLDSLQPILRRLLAHGIDHDDLKSMIDEEVVKTVQES